MYANCWCEDYYLDAASAMLTNAWMSDGYYVGSDGRWILAGSDSSHESILADYSTGIATATPGLIAEYNAEYSVYSAIEGRVKLCDGEVGKLAKIYNDDIGEMAKHHSVVGDSHSTYGA